MEAIFTEESCVYSVLLEISPAEFDELIKSYLLQKIDKIKVNDGIMMIEYAKLFPPTMIGTDYELNRVIRIEEFSGRIKANIIAPNGQE